MHQILQDHVRFKNSQNNTSGIRKISYVLLYVYDKDGHRDSKIFHDPKEPFNNWIQQTQTIHLRTLVWTLTPQKIISPTKRTYSIDPEYKISPRELSTTLIEFLPHK